VRAIAGIYFTVGVESNTESLVVGPTIPGRANKRRGKMVWGRLFLAGRQTREGLREVSYLDVDTGGYGRNDLSDDPEVFFDPVLICFLSLVGGKERSI
jgi:hypothetical protein